MMDDDEIEDERVLAEVREALAAVRKVVAVPIPCTSVRKRHWQQGWREPRLKY